jgi:hypothetical protein
MYTILSILYYFCNNIKYYDEDMSITDDQTIRKYVGYCYGSYGQYKDK